MDAAGFIAGLMLGAGVAAQIGFWLGKRRSRSKHAVVVAATELREASEDLELTFEEEDGFLFERVVDHWEALERSLDALDEAENSGEPDFTKRRSPS